MDAPSRLGRYFLSVVACPDKPLWCRWGLLCTKSVVGDLDKATEDAHWPNVCSKNSLLFSFGCRQDNIFTSSQQA